MPKYVAGPFSSDHIYVQWGGTLPGGEIFSCGLRVAPDASTASMPDVTDAESDAVGAIIGTYHGAPDTLVNQNAVLTYVKTNVIGTDGKYKFSDTHEYVPIGIPGGGGSNPLYPNQVAIAVSLLTDFTRGPAHRGRFYLPIPSIVVQSDGKITAADANRIRATTLTMINALPGALVGMNASVMSRKSGAPARRTITNVQVGRVLDTQRRRRNALTESYVGV